MKILLIIGLILLVLVDYAACCMAHEADERAERMYKEWETKPTDIPTVNTNCVGVAVALLEKEEHDE